MPPDPKIPEPDGDCRVVARQGHTEGSEECGLRHLSLWIASVLACVSICCSFGFAQPKQERLAPVKKQLESLRVCLSDTDKASIEDLGLGLLWGWKNWGPDEPRFWRSWYSGALNYWKAGIEWPTFLHDWNSGSLDSTEFYPPPDSELPDPPPAEYVASLDQDLKACATASATVDRKERSAILEAVASDIRIKADDCKKFGMGRLVPVQVSTLKDGNPDKPDNGWEVLYKYIPVSSLTTAELGIPDLSSPTEVKLPPGGVYRMRARKSGADGKLVITDARTITISSEPVIKCPIPVP